MPRTSTMMITTRAILAVTLTATLASLNAADVAPHGHEHATPATAKTVKAYPFETCLVSKEKLGSMGAPYVVIHDGREIKFCCKGCEKEFNNDATKYVAAFDTAWKKVKPYPLKTCLVSGEELGSMGKPVVFVHKGHEVRLCCKSCVKEFKGNTAKFTKTLIEAAKQKQAHGAPKGDGD